MSLEQDIEKCFRDARSFLQHCPIEIEYCNDSGEKIENCGFPHYQCKKRITEYGGTSSAVAALYDLGFSNQEIQNKVEKSINWLNGRQNKDGSWQACSNYCCEVTAGILSELTYWNVLPNEVKQKAIEYVKSCYSDEGYFCSVPNSTNDPHLYTTFIAVKALKENNMLGEDYKKNIIKWMQSSMSIDKMWGNEKRATLGTVTYTALALLTLCYCDYSISRMKKDYKKQLDFVKESIKRCGNLYEGEEMIVEEGKDACGIKYAVLHTDIFAGPIMGELFLFLNKEKYVRRIVKSILQYQNTGGWGPANDRTTMWATQQAIRVIKMYQKKYLDEYHLINVFSNLNFFFRFMITIVLFMITIRLLFLPEYRSGIIITVIFMFLPWISKPIREEVE